MLTIAYITSRKNPRIEWFLDSLTRQVGDSWDDIKVVIVDHYYKERHKDTIPWFRATQLPDQFSYFHTPPKPSVWQGEHRLTKVDWFAASNARNTALCLAPDGWIAYVDDLSVLMPGWLQSVKDAMRDNYLVCGAYRKVRNLVVENGEVKSFEDSKAGRDSRWGSGSDSQAVPCSGRSLFGCSCAMPVEALLNIGGWPEFADGLSFEDVLTGICLNNAGYGFRYDRRMLTYESEELHSEEPAMRREDWHFEGGIPKVGGNGHNDKSHAALRIAEQSHYFDNYYEGGIRKMREEVLAGNPFPVVGNPRHCWFTKLRLEDL